MKGLSFFSVLCLAITINISAQTTPQEMINKAIYQEEVNGNLEEAIKLFLEIVDKNSTNRAVTVEALYHLGLSNEKLGNKKAREYYEKIVTSFADHPEFVKSARERLARLAPKVEEPKGIKIRQIWKQDYLDYPGTVSFDGRTLAYVYWGKGELATHDLATGEDKILTHEAELGDSFHFAQAPVISKDGSKIAFYWCNPLNTFDLSIINVDDPSPRILFREDGIEVYPVSWLSDNELIAVRQDRRDETTKITFFNASDGTYKDLKRFDGFKNPQIACSPDEKYIAFDFRNEEDKGNFDINIISPDGDDEFSLTDNPANDRVIGWVPGRKEFLFVSDRSGTWDLWAITLENGKPSGSARRLYTNIGEVEPMGFTKNGNCYFGFSRRNFYTSIAPFNPETGEIIMDSGKTLNGSNFGLKWSPDGQFLSYINESVERSYQLTVQNLKTGEKGNLAGNLLTPLGARWSPDGNSILTFGFEKSKRNIKGYPGGIFLVNTKTGKTDEISLSPDYKFKKIEDISDFEWSRDGKSFYYLLFKDRLVKHDLETCLEKIIYRQSNFEPYSLLLSPDGKNLLFGIQDQVEKSCLLVIPEGGGTPRALCNAQETNDIVTTLWSPDGRYIYFLEQPEGTNLWRVPVTGGNPQKVWSSDKRVEIFDIHPDGDKIACSVRERTTEVRVIENLVQELERLDKIDK